jgi:hypothetical protein
MKKLMIPVLNIMRTIHPAIPMDEVSRIDFLKLSFARLMFCAPMFCPTIDIMAVLIPDAGWLQVM